MKNPFLIGEHIYLRAIEASDLNADYREWFNDEEVCHYNSHHRFPNYDENMHEYYKSTVKSQKNLVLGICDKETDAHIGNVALQNIDSVNRSAEFAILIGDKSFWGKGVGTEATRLVLTHAFEQLNLARIYCGTAEDNIGMQKLASTTGFKEEGRARKALFKNGSFKDLIQYGLLKDEYKA
jgi:ribosomal-protein-alanine N-acetyltransferase